MRNGRYDEKDLEEKLMINHRAELVYNHYLKYKSSATIGFCASRNHAEYMTKFFNENNVPSAAVYSGEQGEFKQERSEAIEKLKNNELKILFTVDMFNEGLDIPSIDMVLFLRPTQSPTIFLQQLGRGLRISENKEYLTVLDFIGNYKKANLVPFLLSDNTYDTKTLLNESVLEFEYPQDCFIDFDFQLIDLFKYQARNELKVKDRIILEYNSIKEDVNHRPTRLDLFLRMDDNVYTAMKRSAKINVFRDYIGFLNENNELTKEENSLVDSVAHDFLNTLETTNMTKSYKMPILKAFYNDGDIKMAITDEDVYKSMKEFYEYKSNGVDMIQHKKQKIIYHGIRRNTFHWLKEIPYIFFKNRLANFSRKKRVTRYH